MTASADDIEAYLRKGSVSDWKASAESVPARATPARKPDKADLDGDSGPVRGPVSRSATPRTSDSRKAAPERKKAEQTEGRKSQVDRGSKASRGRGTARRDANPAERVADEPPPAPEPASQLRMRIATPADAAALAKLLRQLAHVESNEQQLARNLEAMRKSGGGMVVAELDLLVGCCAWSIVPTVQNGLIGRITVILVDQDRRRCGIATALLEAALGALAKAGCTRVEAISDIEIENAHNFFRALHFKQTSYRFAKVLDTDS